MKQADLSLVSCTLVYLGAVIDRINCTAASQLAPLQLQQLGMFSPSYKKSCHSGM
jgi:hypothetical protein